MHRSNYSRHERLIHPNIPMCLDKCPVVLQLNNWGWKKDGIVNSVVLSLLIQFVI